MNNITQKPKLNISIMKDNFYWVRPFEKDEFEVARCKDRYRNGKLWFCFTNGSVMEVERAWEVEPLNTSEKLLEIIKDMEQLLIKAKCSLEGEHEVIADEIDGYLQNLDWYIENSKK